MGHDKLSNIQRIAQGQFPKQFRAAEKRPAGADTTPVTTLVDKVYRDINHEALVMAQGDMQKADYLLDCTWYEYFTRREQMGDYVEWHNAEMKKATT